MANPLHNPTAERCTSASADEASRSKINIARKRLTDRTHPPFLWRLLLILGATCVALMLTLSYLNARAHQEWLRQDFASRERTFGSKDILTAATILVALGGLGTGIFLHRTRMKESITEEACPHRNDSLEKQLAAQSLQIVALEEKLRQANALADLAPAGIFHVNADGACYFANESWTTITGRQREQTFGSGWLEAFDIDHHANAVALLRPSGSTARPNRCECRLAGPPTEPRWVLVQTVPQYAGDGSLQGHLGWVTETTQRRLIERRLQDENELLRNDLEERGTELQAISQQLASATRLKDEFLANVSHELRTPLNAILGLSEVLQESVYGPLTEKQHRALQTIIESGRHLLSLVNDILDLSKFEAGKLELNWGDVKAKAVCEACVRLIRESALKKKVSIETRYDRSIGSLKADQRRLKQIILNLLSNAVKFTREGGSIGLEVVAIPDEALEFVVWDTGIGISPENLLRIFKPFVQVDGRLTRHYSGTGLGLNLAMRMAELHGGSITATSQPGEGSRFVLRLPWTLANPSEPEEPIQDPVPLHGQWFGSALSRQTTPPLILVVDDNEDNIMLVSDMLCAAGCRTSQARNGRQAIRECLRQKPDLVLMDIQMPEMDGLEATRQLRSTPEMKGLPIIALTGLAMPGDRERCLAAGMTRYYSKPFAMDELLKVVRSELETLYA